MSIKRMNPIVKVAILAGSLLLLLGAAVGGFIRLLHPSDLLEQALIRQQRFEQQLIQIRGTVYGHSIAGSHVSDTVIDLLNGYQQRTAALTAAVGKEKAKNPQLQQALSVYQESLAKTVALYHGAVKNYNRLGGVVKALDAADVSRVEAAAAAHIRTFETLQQLLVQTIAAHRTREAVISGCLIIGTWILGLFITWSLIGTVYAVLLEKRGKKRIVLGFTARQGENTAQSSGFRQGAGNGILSGSAQTAASERLSGAYNSVQEDTATADSVSDVFFLEQAKEELEHKLAALEAVNAELRQQYGSLQQSFEVSTIKQKEHSDELVTVMQSIEESSRMYTDETEHVKQLVSSFQSGHQLFKTTHTDMQFIMHNVSNIQELAEMIESIAEQTKMLSMNAAIEAAHAGDAGKGFGVVAEELSRLAAAALDSSHDIGGMVKKIVQTITKIGSAGDILDSTFEALHTQTDRMYTSVMGFTERMDQTVRNTQRVYESFSAYTEAAACGDTAMPVQEL